MTHARFAILILSASWLITGGVLLSGLGLCLGMKWAHAIALVAITWLACRVKHPGSKSVQRFMLDGIAQAVGGVTIIQPVNGSHDFNQTLFSIHPHGLTSTGTGFALRHVARRTGKRVSLAVAPLVMASIGVDLISSSRDEITSVLSDHKPVAIVVGGFEEMLKTKVDRDTICCKNRKGFIKLAIKHGYSLTPVYCFGECQLYRNGISLPKFVSELCIRWKIPAVFPIGKSVADFVMPCAPSKGLVIVFGQPLKFDKCDNPDRERINNAHTQYMTAVSSLYKKYNPYPNRKLEIM
jgi:2-acylglycerol O-acyltransferase 2